MGTIWGSGKSENNNQSEGIKPSLALKRSHRQVAGIGRDARLRWTRAQKFSASACLVLLGGLLVVSACSKEESKPAQVGVGGPAPDFAASATQTAAQSAPASAIAQPATAPAAPRKVRRKLAASVTYSDPNSGVSFLYPRKAALTSPAKTPPASADPDDLPMNFVQSGGAAIATVALPGAQYAGTDFAAAEFRVNVNRNLSAEECPHFAFVDTSDADGEPIDAEKVKVGSTEMNMTSEFAGNASQQLETRYYHNYESGACYEYVLGLSTAGFGEQGVHAVDRDQVFAKLEKILASVKIHPVAEQQVAQKADTQKPDVPSQDAQKQTAQKPEAQKPEAEQVDAAPDSDK
jgi:hypothetical protein